MLGIPHLHSGVSCNSIEVSRSIHQAWEGFCNFISCSHPERLISDIQSISALIFDSLHGWILHTVKHGTSTEQLGHLRLYLLHTNMRCPRTPHEKGENGFQLKTALNRAFLSWIAGMALSMGRSQARYLSTIIPVTLATFLESAQIW